MIPINDSHDGFEISLIFLFMYLVIFFTACPQQAPVRSWIRQEYKSRVSDYTEEATACGMARVALLCLSNWRPR